VWDYGWSFFLRALKTRRKLEERKWRYMCVAARVAMHGDKDVFERFMREEDDKAAPRALDRAKLEALGRGPVVEKARGSE
jgi:hypothetical protein